MTDMKERAIALARQGFRVFPLAAGTKDRPIVPPGFARPPKGKYQDLIPSRDPEVVARMWDSGAPYGPPYNIGINTNDLLVVDVDNKNGKYGESAWIDLVLELGLDENTTEARTPTGGRHLLYKSPDGTRARNTTGLLGESVDTRGWHGYVVAPGSRVPAGEYTWVKAPYETPLAPAPEAVLSRLGFGEKDRTNKELEVVTGLELDTAETLARALNWLQNDAPEAVENDSGDAVTYRVACSVKDFGLSQQACLDLMAAWNEVKAHPPWVSGELEQKVANAYAYGTEPIGARAPEAQFEPVDLNVVPLRPERFPLVPYRKLRLRPEVNYLVKGFLPRSGVGVLWGPPKCGKSFNFYDIAMHIALGRPYRGHRVTQGTVVYCAFEGAAGYGARSEAWRKHHQLPADQEVPLYLMPARANLIKDHPQLIASVRAQLLNDPPAMITIDTLNRSFVGSESSDEDMTAYFLAADALRAAFDCFVLIIHHCGLDGTRPRGHTSLTGAVAVQLAQTRRGDDLTVEVEFMRDGPEGMMVRSRLLTLNVGQDVEGDAITSCVTVPITGFEEDVPLTPAEEEWLKKLTKWTEDQRKALGVGPDFQIPITVEVVQEVIYGVFATSNGKNAGRHFGPKGSSRQAVQDRCRILTEKCRLLKTKNGQWVIKNAGNAG